MNIDIDMSRIDTKEPVVAQWALRRIEIVRKKDEKQAREIEDRLFTDDVVENLLDIGDLPFLCTTMIRVLRPEKFKNFVSMLSEKWKEDSNEMLTMSIGVVIAKNNPDAAADLFESFCSQGTVQFGESGKWMDVFNGLPYLSEDRQQQITDLMVTAFEEAVPAEDLTWCFPSILALMWQNQHPRFENVLRDHIRRMPSKDSKQTYAWMLRSIVELLGLSNSEYYLIVDVLEGYPAPIPSEISDFYDPSVPPEELDRAIRDIRKRSFKSIHRFVSEHLFLITDARVRSLWQSLLNDGQFISGLHKKKQRSYFYAMLLCAVTSTLRLKSLSFETFSLEKVVFLLSAQVEDVPDVPAFVSYFKNADRVAAVACLTESLDQMIASGQGNNPLSVIAELDYDEFLAPLTRALCTEEISDPFFQSVVDMIVRFGERAVDFFDTCFSELNENGNIIILNIISQIGGEKAVAFLENHFDACMAIDRGQTLSACEELACCYCLDRIRPKINKHQTDIDDAYMLISLLTGDRTPEIQKMLQAYYQREQENARVMNSFHSGDILGTFKPYMDIELKCRQCGDANTYRVNRVIIDKTGGNYIAQEIECISCGQFPEFHITPSGNRKITMEMMRLTFVTSAEDIQKAKEISPIEMQRFSAFGKEMSVSQAIETYKSRIADDPDNAEYYVGLGNIYSYLDKRTVAAPYLERSIALDPEYVEVYHTLAVFSEDRKDTDKALSWLKKGAPYLKLLKFLKYSKIDPDEFTEEYIGFHNELLILAGGLEKDQIKPIYAPARNDAPSPEPFIREDKKIGRNDPCPCGSGKKYKKCCLGKL
jgi:tetratricopeptide (TPR) repeat protein